MTRTELYRYALAAYEAQRDPLAEQIAGLRARVNRHTTEQKPRHGRRRRLSAEARRG